MRRIWSCVYTNHGQEPIARQSLLDLGFPAFFPILRTESFEKEPKREPMFPRYLFVKLDLDAAWQRARYAHGVTRLMGNATNPMIVERKTVMDLVQRLDVNFEVARQGKAVGDVRVNEFVRVLSGPFRDLEGLCTKVSSQRVTILLQILGASHSFSLDRRTVETAELADFDQYERVAVPGAYRGLMKIA